MKIMDLIESRNNQTIKEAYGLRDKKNRDSKKMFLIDGLKLLIEAIEAQAKITSIFIQESSFEKYIEILNNCEFAKLYPDCSIYPISDFCFEKISVEKGAEGIISVVSFLDKITKSNIIGETDIYNNIVILNQIQDPGNLGAILRSALAFHFNEIILTNDCVDVYNNKTLRSAMGAVFKLKIHVVNDILYTVEKLKGQGRNVYAAELKEFSKPISTIPFQIGDGIVIGNEGHGIEPELSSLCSSSIYIPISEQSESLNASVAASILLWEFGKNN